MLKVNKKVEYALMALKFMVEKGGDLTSAREVCDHFKTPFDTTAKVMQVMNSHDILSSVKGIKGGYTVSANLSEISYLKLARIIEAKEVKSICQTNKGLCELHCDCNIVNPMSTLSEKLNQFLNSLSIQELLFGEEFSDTNKLCPIKDIVKDFTTNGTQV